MLLDYSIRESDRQDIISGLTFLIMSIYTDSCFEDRLLLRLLYNRIMFGDFTTNELYGLLIKCEVSPNNNPFYFGLKTRPKSRMEAYNIADTMMIDSISDWFPRFNMVDEEHIDDEDYKPFVPNPPQHAKSMVAESPWLTKLAQELINRRIFQDKVYYDQYPIPNFIEPKRLTFHIPQEIYVSPAFPVLSAIANLPNLMTFKYQTLPHPQ